MKKKEQKPVIVILDSHAIIHRAYHALPSFTNSRGEPTGALYGLSSMIIRILEEFKPSAVIAAYDLPKPTFRHHAYEAYKGKRAKTDDELIAQIQASREIFKAFNIPVLDAEGFEADDVIGTLTTKLADKTRTIIVASGDMDTLQLVKDKQVMVYTLRKGVQDTVLYDEDAVVSRFGFKPAHLIDYKGLRGDPSDNIIGVPGIGEKTATALISTFGTIEQIYKAIEKNDPKLKTIKITDRIIEILRTHHEDALFSKTLATIRTDAPVEYELPEESYTKRIDESVLLATLQDYEFRSLIPRVKKLFDFQEQEVPSEDGDEELLKKAAIALWVLRSDFTIADRETVLGQTKTTTIPLAFEKLEMELKKQNAWEVFEKLELPLIPVVDSMHTTGIAIDIDYFKKLKVTMQGKLEGIEAQSRAVLGREINLASPKQLSQLLFEELKLTPKGKRKESGAFTTNAEALEGMKDLHPIVPLILEYRETQKLLTTYVEALIECVGADGRVHANFYQNGTTTGRFSSARPNLQNLPARGEGGKDIRKGFVAPPGFCFVSADYSQIELRVLAILSGDKKLQENFKEGHDIHTAVASRVFSVPLEAVTPDMRRAAKVINFGIIYGMGVTALQKNLGTDRAQATQFYENYFAMFPTIKQYLDQTKEEALINGYTTTLFGRRRYFPTIRSPLPHIKAFAERMASNAPLQGTAADILKVAILLIEDDLKTRNLSKRARLVLQVHDELVYEVEESFLEEVKSLIRDAMESVFERSPIVVPKTEVPLVVSVGAGGRLDMLK